MFISAVPWLNSFENQGVEALHVNDMADRWFTKDKDICLYADQHDFTVITKDADFKNEFLLKRTPKKLIKINLGNIPNSELLTIFKYNLQVLSDLIESSCIIEINQDGLFITK